MQSPVLEKARESISSSTHFDIGTSSQNGFWCSVIADALADAGVRFAVLSPGGRSAAMVMSLRQQADIHCVNHIDERSGAFIALSAAVTTGKPAVICTTSGSAVANVLPALTEAYARRLPLIVVSCDRPFTTRGLNPPQSTDQIGICAPLVSAQLSLEDPSDNPGKVFELRRDVLQKVSAAMKAVSAGPVHINVPQPGRLCGNEVLEGWSPLLTPALIRQMIPTTALYDKTTVQKVSPVYSCELGLPIGQPDLKGVIFVGADSPLSPDQIAQLADNTGYPVLADIGSQLRGKDIPNLIYTADVLCLSPELSAQKIEYLIRIGAPPVSSTMQQFLAACDCDVLCLSNFVYQGDYINQHCFNIAHPDNESLYAINPSLHKGNKQWLESWLVADTEAKQAAQAYVDDLPWCELQAAYTVVNAQEYQQFYIANSMSIRHANALMMKNGPEVSVFTQRGVNGIDGSVGSFIGSLINHKQPGLLLIGDETMVHDIAALANPVCQQVRGLICIMNNAGGGIFDFTQSSQLPDFNGALRNAPSVKFEHLAPAFNLECKVCEDLAVLKDGLRWGLKGPGIKVLDIRVPVTGNGNKQQVHMLYQKMLTGLV